MGNSNASKKTAKAVDKALVEIDENIKNAEKNRSYPGTQQNLYTYSLRGWDNYDLKQPDFEAYSGYFTEELSTTNKALITTAEGMLSYESLRSEHVAAREVLVKCNNEIILVAIKLKGYIGRAYPKSEKDSMLSAAGMDNYTAAYNESWDSTAEMSRMMKLFMTNNLSTLLANDNMPADFPATLPPLETNFKLKRKTFLDKEAAAISGIQAKFDINEAIYAALRDMTGVGQIVFKDNKLEVDKFIIAKLLKTARGNSPSGVKGTITTGANGKQPVFPAKVYMPEDMERFVYTDEQGKFELRIPSGKNQAVVVEAEGFVAQAFVKNISVGTMSRLSTVLVPVPVAEVQGEGNSDA